MGIQGNFVKKVKLHTCPKPTEGHMKELELTVGTVWQCDCGETYTYKSSQRDGYYWEKRYDRYGD